MLWRVTLIRPKLRGPTVNDILPKLRNMCYRTIIQASSGYHNLKLNKKLSYLTLFASQWHFNCKLWCWQQTPWQNAEMIMQICLQWHFLTEQKYMPFQVHHNTVLLRNNIQWWSTTRPRKLHVLTDIPPLPIIKRNCNHFRCNELPGKNFCPQQQRCGNH